MNKSYIAIVVSALQACAFVLYVFYADSGEYAEQRVITAEWKSGYQALVEQDILYLKKRVAAIESKLDMSNDYLDD